MGALDKQHDDMAVALQGAYYAAYWNNSGKKGKSLEHVLKQIYKDPNAPKPDVNVNAFLEQKRRFEQNGGFKKRN